MGPAHRSALSRRARREAWGVERGARGARQGLRRSRRVWSGDVVSLSARPSLPSFAALWSASSHLSKNRLERTSAWHGFGGTRVSSCPAGLPGAAPGSRGAPESQGARRLPGRRSRLSLSRALHSHVSFHLPEELKAVFYRITGGRVLCVTVPTPESELAPCVPEGQWEGSWPSWRVRPAQQCHILPGAPAGGVIVVSTLKYVRKKV